MLCVCGCGKKEERKPTFSVSGRVTHQNKPATGALVILHPLDDPDPKSWPNGYPRGYVADDGSFTIGTYERDDGAPTGNYSAIVLWPVESAADPKGELKGDKLKGRYSDPKKNLFPVKVPQAAITLQPWELK